MQTFCLQRTRFHQLIITGFQPKLVEMYSYGNLNQVNKK